MRNAPAARSCSTTSYGRRRASAISSPRSSSVAASAARFSAMPSRGGSVRSRRVDLPEYGWDAATNAAIGDDGARAGRITRIDRGVYLVVPADGEEPMSLAGELKDRKDPIDRPTIGDWV